MIANVRISAKYAGKKQARNIFARIVKIEKSLLFFDTVNSSFCDIRDFLIFRVKTGRLKGRDNLIISQKVGRNQSN